MCNALIAHTANDSCLAAIVLELCHIVEVAHAADECAAILLGVESSSSVDLQLVHAVTWNPDTCYARQLSSHCCSGWTAMHELSLTTSVLQAALQSFDSNHDQRLDKEEFASCAYLGPASCIINFWPVP